MENIEPAILKNALWRTKMLNDEGGHNTVVVVDPRVMRFIGRRKHPMELVAYQSLEQGQVWGYMNVTEESSFRIIFEPAPPRAREGHPLLGRPDECTACGATIDGFNGRTYVDNLTEEPDDTGLPCLHEHWACRSCGSTWVASYVLAKLRRD